MSEVLASSERKLGRPRPRMGLAELMREDIVSGALPAGIPLKTIELSKRYGVSTNPVREALHQLSGEGFVVLSRNRSAQVRSLDESFVRNIFDIRTLIEPYLIRVFVEQAREEDVERARMVQHQLEQSQGDQVEWDSLDEEFHGIMYRRHFNGEARAIRQRHGEVVRALARRYPISPARRAAVLRDHWDIIEAVEAHDADRAAQIVERHARGAERHLLLRMQEGI